MKNKTNILNDIWFSLETNCVLKIKLKDRINPIITAVEHVGKDHIQLKPTCLYGYKLEKQKIGFHEIEAVTRYNTNFDHPAFQKLRYITNNISELKQNFQSYESKPSGFVKT